MPNLDLTSWESDGYAFRPIVRDDLPLLYRLLSASPVREWWGDPDKEIELIEENFNLNWIDSFLVSHRERPFAYIQCYDIFSDDYQPFPDQPAGTRGIDQFIGEPDMIDKGHGSRFISAFAQHMLSNGVARITTDPDPENTRAIRAYEKAGFRRDRIVSTSDGAALLMIRDR